MSPTSTKKAPDLLVVIAFATVYLVWGSTYFFIRLAEKGGMPPFILGAIRFTTAGILLMTWCAVKKEKLFLLKDVVTAAITGILLLLIGNGIVIWSEQTLPSAMVAILVSSAPIWFVVLDKPNWRLNFRSKATIIGMIIGFGGVILLFSEQIGSIFGSGAAGANLPWMLLLLGGSISWSGGSLYAKHNPNSVSSTVSTAWQMIIAGICYIRIAVVHHDFAGFNFKTIQPISWVGLSYLIVFGSIAAYSAYVWLIEVRPATQVSTYAYVNPVIAVILGMVFAGEDISITQMAGLAVILASVLLINLAKYKGSSIKARSVENQNELSYSE